MGFLLYIEIGLALFTVGIVIVVLRLAKRDKAASQKNNAGKGTEN